MNDLPAPAPEHLSVLDRIEEAVRASLERTPEPPGEDEAPAPPPAPEADFESLEACLERAEAAAAGAEEQLAAEQAAWEGWLERLRALREKLAEAGGGPVG